MKFEKPTVRRVYVELTDAETGKRKHLTVYDATLDQVENRLKGSAEDKPAKQRQAVSA